MYRKQVRRRRAVLALLIIGSFLLLSLTYGNSSNGLQRGVSTVFSPLETVGDRALKPARDLVGWFDKTFEARGENDRLQTELAQARGQAIAGQQALQENRQLRKLLRFNRDPVIAVSGRRSLVARVLVRAPTLWHSAVTIDVGKSDGVRVDDPVVSGEGLVGRVASVQRGTAQVLLITDPSSGVSAKVLPSGIQGFVKPDLGNGDLVLDYIDSTRRIGVGQTIVTAGWSAQGFSSLFPPGIPIGMVTAASIFEQEASQKVHLRPFADLANLDIVAVLIGEPAA